MYVVSDEGNHSKESDTFAKILRRQGKLEYQSPCHSGSDAAALDFMEPVCAGTQSPEELITAKWNMLRLWHSTAYRMTRNALIYMLDTLPS